MRIGLMEMKRFAETFHGGIKPQTFLESCGVGDLITTCYNGRNHRVAVEVVRTGKVGCAVRSDIPKRRRAETYAQLDRDKAPCGDGGTP